MQTDQCELRDKIEWHAHQVDTQITEFNRKIAGIYEAIESQAGQLKTSSNPDWGRACLKQERCLFFHPHKRTLLFFF
jgi:hypothetical protein